ncbi:Glycosyltransferase involved in cell wall bisynthesis [Draconibacterium orientale]|uniref:Glycosyl transferase n=1 Tax=Draconibacterium orientale TaxID=1168034 RepID=X5DKA1_9BACT|nr:glycosyltransferase family 4 protein [Draconibacterium orientale]AHW60967.1 glycosyl transferase [Draconibacterium orientale]SET86530.1 Glycosyltransferase involved in cell wall bisynthesis [Draconibacterium orientale]
MHKSKILFILHLPPPTHGSSVVGKNIQRSTLINDTFHCKYVNLNTSKNTTDIGKRSIYKVFIYISILLHTFWHAVTFRPHLCYFAITIKGIGFYKDSLVVLLLKLFGIKLVFHLHNKGVTSRQHKYFDNFLYKVIFKNVTFVLLSEYLYPDIQKYVSRDSVYYCPNGIDFEQQNTNHIVDKFNEAEYRPKTVKILFLSNLIETKGVYVLLDACKILHNQRLNFRCTFVGGEGDITQQKICEKIRSLNMNGSIQYLGKKYGREKETIYSETDIFAFPTFYHNECFPLVLLEAMKHSLPVISTTEGGIRSIVIEGKTGFLVKKGNPEELAKKLRILITNPTLRQTLGSAARIKFEREYTISKFETNLVQILKSILNID